jgi:hypothetical protein
LPRRREEDSIVKRGEDEQREERASGMGGEPRRENGENGGRRWANSADTEC